MLSIWVVLQKTNNVCQYITSQPTVVSGAIMGFKKIVELCSSSSSRKSLSLSISFIFIFSFHGLYSYIHTLFELSFYFSSSKLIWKIIIYLLVIQDVCHFRNLTLFSQVPLEVVKVDETPQTLLVTITKATLNI